MAFLLYTLGVMLATIVQAELMYEDDFKRALTYALIWPALPLVWLAFVAYERWFDA